MEEAVEDRRRAGSAASSGSGSGGEPSFSSCCRRAVSAALSAAGSCSAGSTLASCEHTARVVSACCCWDGCRGRCTTHDSRHTHWRPPLSARTSMRWRSTAAAGRQCTPGQTGGAAPRTSGGASAAPPGTRHGAGRSQQLGRPPRLQPERTLDIMRYAKLHQCAGCGNTATRSKVAQTLAIGMADGRCRHPGLSSYDSDDDLRAAPGVVMWKACGLPAVGDSPADHGHTSPTTSAAAAPVPIPPAEDVLDSLPRDAGPRD